MKYNFGRAFERIDIFGESLPQFNLGGETVVRTFTGGLFTAAIVLLMLAYGSLKLMHLLQKYNPLISEVFEEKYFDSSHVLNINDIGLKFAFSVENYGE